MKAAESVLPEKKEVHAHLYDLCTIKDELDHSIREYLLSVENYQESQSHANVKIASGVFSTGLALGLFFLTRKCEAEWVKTVTALMIGLFWGATYIESLVVKFFFHYIFLGRSQRGEFIKVMTFLEGISPIYTVLMYTEKKEIPSKTTIDIRGVYRENALMLNKFRGLIRKGLYDVK
ncbi:uncharacterized protein NEMAJ01_0134 [Nematocida major]|uniref:uncharacterized protein n=1 Tax=Nematocida major TaxID=1912982 RepID=UPI0020086131|nr:uncharacterized protein NEMAJ01_0134 [Nematocida major]KAH9385238.1 hypothetical protein NEMAJ01_0134 [Nematocida major]